VTWSTPVEKKGWPVGVTKNHRPCACVVVK